MLTSLFRLFYVTAECTGSYKENEANILIHIFPHFLRVIVNLAAPR